MKTLFHNMDLYKGMILGCMLLIPAAGIWTWWLNGKLQTAEKAAAAARRRGGDLSQIGLKQKQVENQLKRSKESTAEGGSQTYFQNWIMKTGTGLKSNDFNVHTEQAHPVGNVKAIDSEVDIDFGTGKDRLALPRDYLNFMLYNIEAQSPIWRLRRFEMFNKLAQDQNLTSSQKAPPPELPDEWYVPKMTFAKREPDTRHKG